MVHFDVYGLTDQGRVRTTNQDQFLIADLRKSILVHQTSMVWEEHAQTLGDTLGHLLMVADGSGDQTAASEASSLAVQTIMHYMLHIMPWFYRLTGQQEDEFLDDLSAALNRCQGRLQAMTEAREAATPPGTTLTMAYIVWPRLYVVHVGNSRCYLLRRRSLEQVTTDHTLAQQLVESGVLQPQDAETTRLSRVLWNAIGGDLDEIRPEASTATLQDGDVLLLCTDGLCRHVPDHVLGPFLQADEAAESTCHTLVQAANEDGGTDNITVIVARFRADTVPPEVEVAAADQAEPLPVQTPIPEPETVGLEPPQPSTVPGGPGR